MVRFTLVELMIVVAIIGILAAIAIPNFYTMQLKAKQAELPVVVDGMVTAVDVALDQFTAATNCPASGLHPRLVGDLDKSAATWTALACMDDVGFAPDGAVRGGYSYVVTTDPANAGVEGHGQADLDGSGDAGNCYFRRAKTNTVATSYWSWEVADSDLCY